MCASLNMREGGKEESLQRDCWSSGSRHNAHYFDLRVELCNKARPYFTETNEWAKPIGDHWQSRSSVFADHNQSSSAAFIELCSLEVDRD